MNMDIVVSHSDLPIIILKWVANTKREHQALVVCFGL